MFFNLLCIRLVNDQPKQLIKHTYSHHNTNVSKLPHEKSEVPFHHELEERVHMRSLKVWEAYSTCVEISKSITLKNKN